MFSLPSTIIAWAAAFFCSDAAAIEAIVAASSTSRHFGELGSSPCVVDFVPCMGNNKREITKNIGKICEFKTKMMILKKKMMMMMMMMMMRKR